MADHWQLWIVIPIVALAAGCLLRRIARFLRGAAAGGCGSQCGGCNSSNSSTKSSTVIPLSSLQIRKAPANDSGPTDS